MTQDPRKMAAEALTEIIAGWLNAIKEMRVDSYLQDANRAVSKTTVQQYRNDPIFRSTVQAIVAQIQSALAALDAAPAHTDHPLRHWDRTCPACIADAAPERDVAERVREACIRLYERGAGWAIRDLDLSQFTERAGGQGNASPCGADSTELATPALPAGMVMDAWGTYAKFALKLLQSTPWPTGDTRWKIVEVWLRDVIKAAPQPADAPKEKP